MNEFNPLPDPDVEKKPVIQNWNDPRIWNRVWMAILGGLLFIGSAAAGVAMTPFFFFAGCVVAVVSLFFTGYRCIFVGFVMTGGCLVAAGIVLLTMLFGPHVFS